MTKQEEIREGLEVIFRDNQDYIPRQKELVGEIIDFLHENDVVIKVNRENLPEVGDKRLSEIKSNGQVYVAVEPLIDIP